MRYTDGPLVTKICASFEVAYCNHCHKCPLQKNETQPKGCPPCAPPAPPPAPPAPPGGESAHHGALRWNVSADNLLSGFKNGSTIPCRREVQFSRKYRRRLGEPCIRFGHTIATTEQVDVTITQGSISYSEPTVCTT